MARSGGLLTRLREEVEQRTGLTVRPIAERDRLEEMEFEVAAWREDAADLAYHSMEYLTGRPQEMRIERRQRLAQRSRVAYIEDPLAGRSTEMLADFAFAKGISKPTARDERVQTAIDRAWENANNQDMLTSFMAQRKLSNDLKTQANLFISCYTSGSEIRIGRLDCDAVENIVVDPEARLRPLWYITRIRPFAWNYEQDRQKMPTELLGNDGKPKVRYYPHWRNVEEAIAERESRQEDALELPPKDKLADGVVYHVSTNQLGEQLFGIPPFARSLRFFSAMNRFTESRVTMAQAASSFIAKRVMKASPSQLYKRAQQVLSRSGELGAGYGAYQSNLEDPEAAAGLEMGRPRGTAAWGQQPGMAGVAPVQPGSIRTENESDRLEALSLNSGASQATQDAQVIRASVAASEGWGQHWLGDASSTTLAGGTTLELPAMMMTGAWQKLFEDLFRWFTDRAIEAAIRNGELGGYAKSLSEGGRPMSKFRLEEAEDVAQFTERTKIDLTYDFGMPFPGRRDLGEVTDAGVALLGVIDPQGANIPLRRAVLTFVLRHGFEMDDPTQLVIEAIPDDAEPVGAPAGALAPGMPGQPPQAGDGQPVDQRSVQGEKRKATTPKEAEQKAKRMTQSVLPPELQEAVDEYAGEMVELYDVSVGAAAANGASAKT